MYNFSTLMNFPFISVSHGILDKEDRTHVRGMLKSRVVLIQEDCRVQEARVWAGRTCRNENSHRARKIMGTF